MAKGRSLNEKLARLRSLRGGPSSPQLLQELRRAFGDAKDKSQNTDKRLMIVTDCHVKGLRTRTYTVATGATVQTW